VTYSPQHVADGQRLTELLDTLERDLVELRQMVLICDDARTTPGRTRADVDGGDGRQAAYGPSRPTETIALDNARDRLKAEQLNGVTYIAHAVACVRGATAGLDRALAFWEGEEPTVKTTYGGSHEGADGAAEFPGTEGEPR
jgi:hypothetical protein